MKNRQRLIVAIGVAALAINALFPPRQLFDGDSVGRSFLLSPMVSRHYLDQHAFMPAFVDIHSLAVGSVVIVGITIAVLAIARRWRAVRPPQNPPLQTA